MKCSVCSRSFGDGQEVYQTEYEDKSVRSCSKECCEEFDQKRRQLEVFSEGLWATQIYEVKRFNSQGVSVTKIDASYKDGTIVQVKLNLPGGVCLSSLGAFLGEIVSIDLTKSRLRDVDVQGEDDGDTDAIPELMIPINQVVDDEVNLKALSEAEFILAHEVCELGSVEVLIEKTGIHKEDAEDIYVRCWKAFDEAREAIRLDGLGLDEKLVNDLNAAGYFSAQQVLSVKAKELREETKLPQSRIGNVRTVCKAAVDGAKAAVTDNSSKDSKGKDGKAA